MHDDENEDDLPVGLEHYREHVGIRDGLEGHYVNADPGASPVPFTEGSVRMVNRSGAYVPREQSLIHEFARPIAYGLVALFWVGILVWFIAVVAGRFSA